MSRLRSLSLGLALFSASLLLTLSAVEVLLRVGVFPQRTVRSTAVVDRATSKMNQPDFREPGFELRGKEDAFRVVVLGDSFAWGDGVYFQDAFPYRLEARLNKVSKGQRFEVVNWSRPGWNTVRQRRSLELRLDEVDPDLLILAFVLNDPEPVDRTVLEQMLSAAEQRQPEPGISSWLFARSHLYRLVWSRLENSRTHRELGAFYRSLFEAEHWEACQRALKRLRNLTRRRGVPMVVVVFPVFDSPMDSRYPYSDLHAKITHAAESLKIPVLDLLPVFWGMDAARLAVVPFTNAHPTEIAHRVATDGILDYLVRKKLVPPVNHRPRRLRR